MSIRVLFKALVKTKILTDKQLIKQLLQAFEILKKENAELRLRMAEPGAKSAKYGHPKNSGNSSMSPSQDPFGKTKSLRKKSNSPQGGQKGHEGSNPKMIGTPDTIPVHHVGQCSPCVKTLSDDYIAHDARQVFDIPPIKIQVTGHRRPHKKCTCCGKPNRGTFPKELRQEAQYGAGLKSLCVSSKLSNASLLAL